MDSGAILKLELRRTRVKELLDYLLGLYEHGFDSLEEVNNSQDYTLAIWEGEHVFEDVTHNFEQEEGQCELI